VQEHQLISYSYRYITVRFLAMMPFSASIHLLQGSLRQHNLPLYIKSVKSSFETHG